MMNCHRFASWHEVLEKNYYLRFQITSNEDATDSSQMSTTTEAYRISRYELGRILGRNFRGLQRLQEIEIQDALNVSDNF